MKPRVLVALTLAMLGLVGSSVADALVEEKTKKPCQLLKVTEVGDAFSLEATQVDGDANSCNWSLADGGRVFLGVSKVDAIAKEDFATNSKSSTAEKVAGLKKSFYDTGTVTFIKGKSFVNIQFLGTVAGDDSVVANALGGLAKKAAKRL